MNAETGLYACIYAKEFPSQALLRLRPELRNRPCVVLESKPPIQHVCSMNAKAREAGAMHGMTRIDIETLDSIQVMVRSMATEEAATQVFLECAGTFSPRLENRSSGASFICVLEISGTEKLFGPPRELGEKLRARLQELGLMTSLAISHNVPAAICVAKGLSFHSPVLVIPAEKEAAAALAELPLTVLELSEEQADTFSFWGIHTLRELAALPETELIARMGQEGRRLQQMARGECPHLFQPIETRFTLEERMELDSPVESLDALLFACNVMLEQLILRAASRILAIASVTITLSLDGGEFHTRTIRPAVPTSERRIWLKLIQLDQEVHPPQAAVLALTLSAEPGVASKVQLGLFSPQLPEPARLDITLARIAKIVGEDHVGRAVLEDTHHPESFRMERFVPPFEPPNISQERQTFSAIRQLRPQEEIIVSLEHEQPGQFSFRARKYVVEHAYGPWLSTGNWWNSTLWGHEQWDIVARDQDGRLLFCCMVRDLMRDRWQMAGLYD